MLIGSISKDLMFHEWPGGKLLHVYKPLNDANGLIKTISWGKDGAWLVLVPAKGLAEVISIKEDIKLLHTIHDIKQPTCAAFQNATKKYITLGTVTGQVLVYDVKQRSIRKTFPKASSAPFYVEYCSSDTHIVAAFNNGEILLYNQSTCNTSAMYKVPNSSSVSTIRFHKGKRNLLAGGSNEGTIAVWDINDNKIKFHTQAHVADVTEVAFSPLHEELMLSLGLDRKFVFYDFLSKQLVANVAVDKSMTSVDFSPDGMNFATANIDGLISTYDMRNLFKPMSCFSGTMNEKIVRLRFQNGGKVNTSVSEVTEERIKTSLREAAHNSLSFDAKMTTDNIFVESGDRTMSPTQEAGDSFAAAVGIDFQNFTYGSPKCDSSRTDTDDVVKLMEAKLVNNVTGRLVNSSQNKLSKGETPTMKVMASTPKYPIQQPPSSSMSPIVGINQSVAKTEISVDYDKIREMIKEELNHLKEDFRYGLYDVMANERRHVLDLQLSIVKEFINLEGILEKFKQNIAVEECSIDDLLLQQLIRLKQENEQLKAKLNIKNLH